MQIGVVYPQTEYEADPAAVRAFAQRAEALGYAHILAYEHVLGANPDRPGGWQGPYTIEDAFLEPFVLFSHMAAVTTRIGFTTGILVLPLRQTALVAKQAATLDVLSSGRLRLGVGVGWNAVEFTAMGMDFRDRGERIEEQIDVLRRLWAQSEVDLALRWHHIPRAGLNPLPIQRPIPIWMGGHADRVLRRAARMADGWLLNYATPAQADPSLQKLRSYVEREGRAWEGFGIEPRVRYGDGNLDELRNRVEAWRAAGATHLTLNTMRSGLTSNADHLLAMERFAIELGLERNSD